MPDQPGTLSCAIAATGAGLPGLTAAVDRLAVDGAWAPGDLVAVQVALDEVVSNVVKYAGLAEGAEIRVDIRSGATLIEIEVRDAGRPFDPLCDRPAAQARTASGVAIGGRGIAMVRRMMDEVRYRRDGGENALTMVRRRTPSGTTGKE